MYKEPTIKTNNNCNKIMTSTNPLLRGLIPDVFVPQLVSGVIVFTIPFGIRIVLSCRREDEEIREKKERKERKEKKRKEKKRKEKKRKDKKKKGKKNKKIKSEKEQNLERTFSFLPQPIPSSFPTRKMFSHTNNGLTNFYIDGILLSIYYIGFC